MPPITRSVSDLLPCTVFSQCTVFSSGATTTDCHRYQLLAVLVDSGTMFQLERLTACNPNTERIPKSALLLSRLLDMLMASLTLVPLVTNCCIRYWQKGGICCAAGTCQIQSNAVLTGEHSNQETYSRFFLPCTSGLCSVPFVQLNCKENLAVLQVTSSVVRPDVASIPLALCYRPERLFPSVQKGYLLRQCILPLHTYCVCN